ncbi:MAG TPA: chemotaxis protein CheW [Anaerolineales bacterium]|nr:chemotaxis protein CheW [Anaerolineales bacterium]
MENQIVVFELGSEHFGVSIAAVQSIIKLQPITQLPHAPGFVEGVTNLRGHVLPVIDLRKRFGLSTQKADKHSRIMVVSVDQVEVGMIVDGVSEVLTVPEQTVEPAPTITTTVDSAFIAGIAKIGSAEGGYRLVILLDLGKIFSLQEQQSLAKAAI